MKSSEKRRVERLGGALLYGGAIVTGLALGTFSLVSPSTQVEAGEANYVRSASHDAIAGVRLDEEITIRFKSEVLRSSVGPDTILIRTGSGNTEQARGNFFAGKFMFDKSTQRRVVVRPEAIQEFFQLEKGLSRNDAKRKTTRLLDRIERTGRIRRLAKIDKGLVRFFGPSYGAGTRLDDDAVTGVYPPQLADDDSLVPYRQRIAGDDALYEDYLVNGNLEAFAELKANSEYERFFHEVDPATGVPSDESVLRERDYRRVLINRQNERRIVFVPEIPIRADLADSGFVAGKAYSIVVPASQPGIFNTILTKKGQRPLLQDGGRDFSTLFTTVAGSTSSSILYLGGEARSGVASLQKPRVICMTPPNGESFVDATTDWEDPDNQFEVPVSARKTFTVRLRFAQPIDPRTVSPANFTITKVATSPGTPNEREVAIPVAVGTFLNQTRQGIVEVEVTPATNLDPESQYEVVARGNIRTLGSLSDGSQALLGTDFRASFIVGPGPVPLNKIKVDFTDNEPISPADPTNPDTFGQQTTALWGAPALFDDNPRTGKLVASFMPFTGYGEGAPEDPQSPDGGDTIQNLVLAPGESITWVTEGLDPGDQATFGKQIEYEYQSVRFDSATANTIGRYPLVVRSQGSIVLNTSSIFANGQPGGFGRSNTDTVGGGPTGGLGGAAGSGGFRGGDGAFAPLTDAAGEPILDGFGQFQFDSNKFDGLDGMPSYLAGGLSSGGAGSGGFSGDQEGTTATDPETGNPVPESSPARTREAGGGGAHAEDGTDGASSGGTAKTHPDGYLGGLGGNAYGEADMSDQPINAKGAPTLGLGAGGAGGGGGGGEDDAPLSPVGDGAVGPEDAGGGGGGGGGGGIQLVARDEIRLDSSILDATGGIGGRTFDASLSDVGEGAPGGSGAGGTIWLQCFGDVLIQNGSVVDASGGAGDQTNNIGQVHPDPPDTGVVTGLGGNGGNGYLRFEDSDGQAVVVGSNVSGSRSDAQFRPVFGPGEIVGDYPAHPGVPMVVSDSEAFSPWFNSQLDTPSYVAVYDDPLTPEVEGTAFEEFDHSVDILVRGAPGDPNNPGHPLLSFATEWRPLDEVDTISDRRFLQFRVLFEMKLEYTFDQPRPFVDCVEIAIELQ